MRVVAADADAVAGLEARAALADDDLAAGDDLAGEHLHAEALGVRVAAVAGGAEALLVCHYSSSSLGSSAFLAGGLRVSCLISVTSMRVSSWRWPCAPAIAPLGLELEHAQLLAAQVLDDLRVDLDLGQAVGVEDDVVGAEEDRLQRHRGAGVVGQPLDEQGLALLDAVLLATGLDDRVHVLSQSEVVSALAAERRRPPLRPRRRGVDSTSSPSEAACSSADAGSSSAFASALGADFGRVVRTRLRAPASRRRPWPPPSPPT